MAAAADAAAAAATQRSDWDADAMMPLTRRDMLRLFLRQELGARAMCFLFGVSEAALHSPLQVRDLLAARTECELDCSEEFLRGLEETKVELETVRTQMVLGNEGFRVFCEQLETALLDAAEVGVPRDADTRNAQLPQYRGSLRVTVDVDVVGEQWSFATGDAESPLGVRVAACVEPRASPDGVPLSVSRAEGNAPITVFVPPGRAVADLTGKLHVWVSTAGAAGQPPQRRESDADADAFSGWLVYGRRKAFKRAVRTAIPSSSSFGPPPIGAPNAQSAPAAPRDLVSVMPMPPSSHTGAADSDSDSDADAQGVMQQQQARARRRASTLVQQAMERLQRHDSKGALNLAEEAVRLAPRMERALSTRAMSKKSLGLFEEAISDAMHARTLDPNAALPCWTIADAKRQMGRYDEAAVDASEAVRLNKNEPLAWRTRADCRLHQGRMEEAAHDAAEALRLDPRDSFAHAILGAALRAMGLEESARTHLQEALRLKPNNKLAQEELRRMPEGGRGDGDGDGGGGAAPAE